MGYPEDYEDPVVQEDLATHAAGTLQSLSEEEELVAVSPPRPEGKCMMVVGIDENEQDIICGNPCNASEQDCHWCRQNLMHMMYRF